MRDKFKRYDRFRLSSEQIYSLIDLYGTDKTVSEQLSVISIPNFVVESDDGLHYGFTYNQGLSVSIWNSYERLLEFFVVFYTGKMVPIFSYKNESWLDFIKSTTSQKDFEVFIRQIVVLYGVLNTLSVHRPTLFKVTERQVTIPKDIVRKGTIKRISETRMIKFISLDGGELPKRHNNITCECWGVAGHYRSYKNGKTIFIAPYRKGKKRNDPEAYTPKNYKL